MATFPEVAPELSKFVTEPQALAIADRVVGTDAPAPTKTLADLSTTVRGQFFKWLQWYKSEKKPLNLPAFIHEPPIRVSHMTGMSVEYIESLIEERDRIFKEAARGEDAFTPDPETKPEVVEEPVIKDLEGDLTPKG